MLGKLIHGEKVFPIINFLPPDKILLKGSFAEFETSLAKSKHNQYELVDCDDTALLLAWENVQDCSHE